MTTAVRERPILFSAPMVRAILDGRKTQTRRIIAHAARGADRVLWTDKAELYPGRGEPYVGWVAEVDALGGKSGLHLPLTCPHGQPGDRLRVRERWGIQDCGSRVSLAAEAWPEGWPTDRLSYLADGAIPSFSVRSSLFMPRWASRLTLEVVSVRAQRVQEISEKDAVAEGIESAPEHAGEPTWKLYDGGVMSTVHPLESFASLWESVNGPGAWARNDWVWAVEFKRLEGGGR